MWAMDTSARVLRLLVLFATRPRWTAPELTERLEVTARTLRRDIDRLRALGYPITSTTGPYGGYELGAGGRMPPLVLDDDEAVAVAIALAELSRRSALPLEDAAVAALAKLDQVLPPALRERVAALGSVTEGVQPSDPIRRHTVDVQVLVALALACRRGERVRFTYRDGSNRVASRLVEPHRLVALSQRWYLVAFDLDRRAWRSFRLDRVSELVSTGARFVHADPPDAARFVAEGVAVGGYATQARVRLLLPPDRAAAEIPAAVGVIEPGPPDATTTVVRIGGDLDWVARFLAGRECRFEVIEPPELRAELRKLARALLRDHRDG
jgi:predicted DNA-binding transcriptional regulator YafY